MSPLLQTPFGRTSTAAEVIEGVDLSGKRAIVTGAGSGIGIETARALASAGAEVTMAVRRPQAAEEIAAGIVRETGNAGVSVRALDLSDQDSVRSFAAAWEQPLTFSKTYYVDNSDAKADDNGPGTRARPFRTINKAAALLQPGERVVIAAGTYRECVRPARGGTSPSQMISYEAAPGARVVIKGSEVLKDGWVQAPISGAGPGRGARGGGPAAPQG